MPELPEVETVRCGLAPALEGKVIARVHLARPDLRFPFPPRFAERLTGRRLLRLDRRAKFLLGHLDDGATWISHLGMSGAFRVDAGAPGAPIGAFVHPRSGRTVHDHVRLDVSDAAIVYNDPRRFGFMTLAEPGRLHAHPFLAGLGVEPTAGALTAERLAAAFSGRLVPLKAALLDQRIVAGLGNIYVCEALWRARLSPRRKAGTLVLKSGAPSERLARLTEAIIAVIEEAIEAGGSSLRDYVATDGSLGRFQHRFSVYGREAEPCLRPACRGIILRFTQSGRSTWACPVCQR